MEVNHVGEIFPGTWDDILNYLDTNGYDLNFKIPHRDIPMLGIVYKNQKYTEYYVFYGACFNISNDIPKSTIYRFL